MEIIKEGQSAAKLSNDKFLVLSHYKIWKSTKYVYYYRIKCKICGEESDILTGHLNRQVCHKCKDNERRHLEGKIIGNKKVLKYLGSKNSSGGKRHYYLVECIKCGEQYEIMYNTHNFKESTMFCTSEKCQQLRAENLKARTYNTKRSKIEPGFVKVFNSYVRSAKDRHLSFDLTEQDAYKIIKQNCFYCGEEPEPDSNNYIRNGIDRVDPKRGYTLDNCVPCCTSCNKMKSNMTLEHFFNKISNIYHNLERSTTISKESTSQANGDGNGRHLNSNEKDDDIV